MTALITLFFGARLIMSPTRRLLDWSAAWAVLSVSGGVLQIAGGTISDVFALATITAAVAGVLSWVGRQAFASDPDQSTAGSSVPARQESVPSALSTPAMATAVAQRAGTSTAERVVIVLIILAALGGGVLVFTNMPVKQTLDAVASAIPTTRPTVRPTTPPAGELEADLGEIVDLVDTNADDLGNVAVIKNGKPSTLYDLPPATGNRYIAALVNYTARASWYYSVLDWVAHDARQIQYEPLGIGPSPTLVAGTLSAGHQVEAWVAFEVPESVRDVWLDFRTSDGEVIFSVKID